MPMKRLASAVSVGSLPLQQLDPFQHNQERIELRAEPRIGRGGEEDGEGDTRPFPVAEVYDAMTISYFNEVIKPPTTPTMSTKPLMLWEALGEAEAQEQVGGGDPKGRAVPY